MPHIYHTHTNRYMHTHLSHINTHVHIYTIHVNIYIHMHIIHTTYTCIHNSKVVIVISVEEYMRQARRTLIDGMFKSDGMKSCSVGFTFC